MPKRSYEEKFQYYMRKMEKLQDKHRHKRRRRDNFALSLDDDNQENETAWDTAELPTVCEMQPVDHADIEVIPNFSTESIGTQENHVMSAVPTISPVCAPETPAEPQLDPEILLALGEATDLGPVWGQEIHNNLTQLWQPLLVKGMNKDVREKTLKEYLVPSNCKLLQAPKLNIEVAAAVTDMVRLRDKKIETSQQQLGVGITAISRAMTSLISNSNRVEVLKTLSDGCRILCDLHHYETQSRIKMITPGLAKPFLSVIQDNVRDDTLFGTSLPDKIKASKTIEKQGLQIKKSVPQPMKSNSAVQPQTAPTPRHQFQGNWAGPSRYPANRGGRGGQKRYPAPARRSAVTPATATSQTKSSRSRAPTRQ